MPVVLRRTIHEAKSLDHDRLIVIPGNLDEMPPNDLFVVTEQLEACFDEEAATWLEIGKRLSANMTATLAHTPACVANASDFGEMLAWSKLIGRFARDQQSTVIVCGDPWLYRHLQAMGGLISGPAPGLLIRSLGLWLRGYLARVRVTIRLAHFYWGTRHHRSSSKIGDSVLLVYGHPNSSADGKDGYFGDLMQRFPTLTRILHVDCDLTRVRQLFREKRTVSLHAWGSILDLIVLPFAKWRPGREETSGKYGWLIRRSAALEAGTGQAAMIQWQIRCQTRWLRERKPTLVSWPWENHSWEREFSREARRNDVSTVGYQHSVIGRQMLNYSSGSNPDGKSSLPDRIVCSGQVMVDQLKNWDVPDDRLTVGGAFRFNVANCDNWNSKAPVYMALPFDFHTSAEMVAMARDLAKYGYKFQIKPHPMTPYLFSEVAGVSATTRQFHEEPGVSAVVFAASAVGVESHLAGLPTIRFRPTNRISLDILPAGVDIPAAGAKQLTVELMKLTKPTGTIRDQIFSPVDLSVWRTELGQMGSHETL